MKAPAERLGAFYLGAEYDLKSSKVLETPINYDARDLTTHAVCVGMTGSGKTGLCVGLLEEAAIDKVPAILIDPKGDITNLLLQFPELRPGDFEPWVNTDDARRKGQTVAEYAQSISEMWQNGLAEWGIDSDRIRLLQENTEYTIYTPGSDAGVPISILGSLAAPKLDFEQYAEAIRERISGTVVALLGLVGIKADPITSRETTLLANIFEHFWQQQQDMDLTQLIMSIQNPPVRQIGVFDVDTFFPQKERFELAMAFNNLMASPNFQSWLEGEALDVDRLFFTDEGQPRHSIFYIAHLSDSERMFFVTLLLENILTWVRGQAGTSSLRALLYFDEVFGFIPPVAEPPSKRPLLTLLKQARAFGLGCVLVTQNPVDLDYKGLTNTGTWFIGKLQAERDKARVLEGLESAIAETGSGQSEIDFDALISQLGSRIFLLHNVHENAPVIFHTRWAMSYLRGPLTRPQVRQLMARKKPRTQSRPMKPVTAEQAQPDLAIAAAPAASPKVPTGFLAHPPGLDPDFPQVYLALELNDQAVVGQLSQELGQRVEVKKIQLIYEPGIIGGAEVRFIDRKRDIDERLEKVLLALPPDEFGGIDWGDAEALAITLNDLVNRPEQLDAAGRGPFFAPVPETANSARELKSISTDLEDWLYYNSRQPITVHPELGLFQQPNESTRAFRIRLQQAARENRDEEVDRLEKEYEKKMARLEDKIRREERELAEDEAEYDARKREEMIGLGESVLGFFVGRRSTRTLSRAASRRRMTGKAKLDIEESQEEITELKEEIQKLEAELQEEAKEITRKWADLLDEVSTEELTPRRTDVNVQLVALAWLPSWLINYSEGGRVQTATLAAYALPEE